MEKPSLYALVVGINDYQSPVGKLKGCRPDAESMAKYLTEKEKDNFKIVLKTLYDKEATHANICQQFQTHLARATANDVVLFFFAGHGAQEVADDAWREPNKKLEGLVCYDSINSQTKRYRLLADKEMRYLLHYVANKTEHGAAKTGSPHIVVVSDCCHSGENTRDVGGAVKRFVTFDDIEGRGAADLPARKWEDFMFAKTISQDTVAKTKSVNDLLPQVAHVALAACQADELASEDFFEDKGMKRGVFTKNLIDILERTEGAVSYNDLRSRIKNYVKNKFTQVPQIYAAGDKTAIFKNFLGRSGVSGPVYGNVQVNDKNEWVMDMGAIQGISGDAKTVNVVSDDGKEKYEASIKMVRSEDTVLAFVKEPPRGKEYKGAIANFFSAPIAVFIDNMDKNVTAETVLKAKIEGTKSNISVAKSENLAEYAVRIFNGYYVITRRVDMDKAAKYRPLVWPIKVANDAKADVTYSFLYHISQWEYVKNLENTATNSRQRLNADAVDLQVVVVKNGKEIPVPIKENPNNRGEELMELVLEDGVPMKMKIVNNSAQKLYVTVLYLGNLFEVSTGFLGSTAQMLEEKGAFVEACEGQEIPLVLEPHIKGFNFPASDNYFKLIVSTADFDVDEMQRDVLPDPMKLFDTKRGGDKRGPVLPQRTESEGVAWTTRTILFRNPNPNYGKKSASHAERLSTEGGIFLEKLY